MSDLKITLAGIDFPNPVFLASGILDETGESMVRVAELGAGGVVTKSVGSSSRTGHPNPTVVETEAGLLNAMGLPNPGMKLYVREIMKASRSPVPIIASIFSDSPEGFAVLAGKARASGAVAVEINLSCPHAKGLGLEMGQDPVLASEIVKAAKIAGIPVFPKLSPHVNNIAEMAKALEQAGADGLVAINTLRAMAIDVDTATPVLGNIRGGLSGPAIKPVGIRMVYELYCSTKLPIIGVGGISSGTDALEYILAGASAVQVGTAALHRGPEACGEIAKELGTEMERLDYATIADAVGKAHWLEDGGERP